MVCSSACENIRKEPSRFFPFFVYVYFFLYTVSLFFILGSGSLLSQSSFLFILLLLILFYGDKRAVVFSKIGRLYKIFIFIAIFKVIQEKTGRLIFDITVIQIYEDGLLASLLLFVKLCSLALNAFLFIEILGDNNLKKFIKIIFWPFEKLGFSNGGHLAQLLIRAYDLFPFAIDILKKGIKKGFVWMEGELKTLLNASCHSSKQKLTFCSVKFVYLHSFSLFLLPVFFVL